METGVEQCDSGPLNSNTLPNACRTTCKLPGCGDGVMDIGETCDDGNTSNNDSCLNTCRLARCGDGIVDVGVEQCDDGNLSNTHGCLTTCMAARGGDGTVRA